MDTQLNALPTLPVLARTVSGCVNSAFLNKSQHFTGHLFRPWIPNSTRCQHFLSSLEPFLATGYLNSAFLGLERNRSAVGKTKAPLPLHSIVTCRSRSGCHTLETLFEEAKD